MAKGTNPDSSLNGGNMSGKLTEFFDPDVNEGIIDIVAKVFELINTEGSDEAVGKIGKLVDEATKAIRSNRSFNSRVARAMRPHVESEHYEGLVAKAREDVLR